VLLTDTLFLYVITLRDGKYLKNSDIGISPFFKCFTSRSVITYKHNVSVNNTTLYFIYNKNRILSGQYVSTFNRSSSGPLGSVFPEGLKMT